MNWDENELNKLIETLSKGEDVKYSDIPDIDLYMDQVTTFIDNKLGYLKRDKNDKMLTKTMINNYTKSKILLPSKNKRYTRQHMVLLILVYYLKQVLSINDISLLFSPFFKNLAAGKDNSKLLEVIYNTFLEINQDSFNLSEDARTQKIKIINENVQGLQEEDRIAVERILTVIMLATQANTQKRLAEKIIDTYFISNEKTNRT